MPTPPDPHLAVAYARVSTAEQAEGGMSLDAQLGAVRAHSKQRGLTLLHEYVERGASGTDDDRPEFQRMIEALLAPSNTVGIALVLHTSRFMRDVELARRYKRELKRRGVRVVAVQQEVGDDPNGELMEGVYELFDQHESRIIGVRTRAAMNENVRAGFFNGASPPYGFAVERVEGPGGRAKRKLMPNPDEARVVRLVFERYIAGTGAKNLARALNAEGVRYRDRLWSRDRVLDVLEDSSAIGDYRWGRKEARTGRRRDERDQVRSPVAPIVSQELFDAVQRVRRERDPKDAASNAKRPIKTTQLLGGLLRCGRCGARYQLETSGKQSPTGRPAYRYYNCSVTCRTGREACAGYRVRTDTMDTAVLGFLASELFTPDRCRTLLAEALGGQDKAKAEAAERRCALEAELAEIRLRITRWTEAFETGGDLATLGLDRLRELRARQEEVQRAVHAVTAPASLPPFLYKPETLDRFTARLRTAFADAQSEVARAYLERLVERIEITDGDVAVYGRAADVVATMAEKGPIQPARSRRAKVRTYVVGWRANPDTSANFSGRFRVEARRRSKPKIVPTEPPHIVRLLERAEAWQADLDAGRVKNRAALAVRERTSTVRVTQILRLRELDPSIREWIRSLPPGTPARYVAERQLRSLTMLPAARQVAEVRRRWALPQPQRPKTCADPTSPVGVAR